MSMECYACGYAPCPARNCASCGGENTMRYVSIARADEFDALRAELSKERERVRELEAERERGLANDALLLSHVEALKAERERVRELQALLIDGGKVQRMPCPHQGIGLPGCVTCDPRVEDALSPARGAKLEAQRATTDFRDSLIGLVVRLVNYAEPDDRLESKWLRVPRSLVQDCYAVLKQHSEQTDAIWKAIRGQELEAAKCDCMARGSEQHLSGCPAIGSPARGDGAT